MFHLNEYMFNKMNLTNIEINLLYYLSIQKNSKYSKEISREAKISTGAASESLRKLAKQGLIRSEEKGKEKYYSVDLDNSFIKNLKIALNVLSIQNLINELKEFSEKIVLFGSYADGLNTEESDIDLFVLCSDKSKIKKILNIYKLKKKLSVILLTTVEYTLLKKKDKPLYDEINKGTVLWNKKNEQI